MGCFTAGGGEMRQKGGREGASLDPCGRRVTAKGGAEGYALRAGLGWGWRGGGRHTSGGKKTDPI